MQPVERNVKAAWALLVVAVAACQADPAVDAEAADDAVAGDAVAGDSAAGDSDGEVTVTPNPGPNTPIPPMEYASTPSFAGTVTCGPAPAPYFWATAAEPAPLACTDSCAPAPHALATVCAGGQCLAASCESGWQDQNGWGADGCEVSVPVACVVHVEVTADAATADGTPEHPFAAIVPAVAKASPGCEIRLGAGTFDSPTYGDSWAIELNKPGLVLRGQGPGKTRIRSKALSQPFRLMPPIVGISADGVVVEGLAVEGAGHGIVVQKAADVLVRNLAVGPLTAPNYLSFWYDSDVVPLCGIRLLATDGARVTLGYLHDIQGSVACEEHALDVAGVYGEKDVGTRVLGTKLKALTGGKFSSENGLGNTLCVGTKKTGTATGIRINGRTSGCAASDLAQGQLVTWNSSGTYEASLPNPVQAFVGALNDLTNTYNGLPFLHFANCAGLKLDGFDLTANASTIDVAASSDVTITNCTLSSPDWSGIRVVDSDTVHIQGSKISGLAPGIFIQGSANLHVTGNQIAVAARASETVGLSVSQCGDCEVAANKVSVALKPNPGDPTWTQYTNKLFASATGVSITECAGCTFKGNEITDVVGPPGFYAKWQCQNGGDVTGVSVTGPGPLVFAFNRVRNVRGGPGVCGEKADLWETYCTGGAAVGAYLGNVADVSCSHNDWSEVEVGDGLGTWYDPNLKPPPPPPPAIALIAPSGTVCDHVTLSAVATATTSPGITFTNSILASGDACSLGKNPKISMSYSDVWGKGSCVGSLGSGAGMMSVDPQFVDAKNGDVHLLASSPCIDSADPAAEFCSEALPNGCRADMGAYGGTSASTPASGAKSCACP